MTITKKCPPSSSMTSFILDLGIITPEKNPKMNKKHHKYEGLKHPA